METTTEADFSRPFQVVQDLALPAANRLRTIDSPLYEAATVTIFHDGRQLNSLNSKIRTFNPPPDKQVMKLEIPGWELKTDRFFLNYKGRMMVQWYGDHATLVVPRTYDTIRSMFELQQLQDVADELIGIVGGAV